MDRILAALSADATVVTATSQQAAHLRWRYARQQQAAGHRAWRAPRVQLLSQWIEQAWETSLLAGGIGAERQLLSRSQTRRLWQQVLGADLDAAPPLITLVESAWRSLHDWRISLDAVGRLGSGTDAEAFHAWAKRYRRLCRESAWLDSVVAMGALRQELEAGPRGLPPQLLFVGFDAWHPGLQSLTDSLRRAGCDAGEAQPCAAATPAPKRAEFAAENQEFEAAAVWAAQAWHRAPDSCIALVVPELEQAGPALRRALLDAARPAWRQGAGPPAPVIGGEARHVADLGAVHAALLCLGLYAARVDYQRLGQLLRSPYIGGATTEQCARAALDAWLRERGEREWEIEVVRDKAAEFAPDLAQRLQESAGRPPSGQRSPAGWAGWITAQLQRLGWPGKTQPDADDAVGIEAWRALLDKFAACSLVSGPINFSAARRMLTEMAREERAPAGTTGRGLQLLSPAEALGMRFDGLWIAGLHGEAWPPPMRPNPLIPLSLQRQSGLPAAAPDSHARHARGQMDKLWGAAGQVMLSAARRRGDESLTPTPALADIRVVDVVALNGAHPPSLTEQMALLGETEIVADPAPALTPHESLRGGVRLLQLQAVCPARAFFELRLHARELPLPAFGIDAPTRGQLVHSVLDRLYGELRDAGIHPTSPEARQRVPGIVRQCLQGRVPPTPLNRVLAELEGQRLELLVHQLLDFEATRPDFRVSATEARLLVPLGSLELKLRVDRIDELEGGEQLVIDYKTGGQKSSSDWLGERPAEPQLPLYAVGSGARSVAYIRLSEEGVRLDGVAGRDTGIAGMWSVGKLTRARLASWPELVGEWRAALVALAAEFAAGACCIDGRAPDLAAGDYAPLTRVYDARAGD